MERLVLVTALILATACGEAAGDDPGACDENWRAVDPFVYECDRACAVPRLADGESCMASDGAGGTFMCGESGLGLVTFEGVTGCCHPELDDAGWAVRWYECI